MEKVTQKEEEVYQKGRRDGFKGAIDQELGTNQIYRSGYESGVLERHICPEKFPEK